MHEELRALPESERAVLELVSVDGLTVAEAAAALNIKPVAARVRLHRARAAGRPAGAGDIHGAHQEQTAAQRFAALSAAARHAWLAAHLTALRAAAGSP
jgi:hypothetical protein